MKKNNNGFSLVELIVVIAIMALLVTSVVTYVSLVSNSQAKKCAKELSTHMSQTKVCAMSRTNASMTVYKDDTGIYVKSVQGDKEQTEKIGDKGVYIGYRDVRDSDVFTELDSTGIELKFDRASGACKKMDSGKYCYGFKIQYGDTVYIVALEPLTGKSSIQ